MTTKSKILAHRTLGKIRNLFSNVLFWFGVVLVAFTAILSVHFVWPLSKPRWWADFFGIAVGFLASGITSFLFYFLVVYVPERRRKKTIKSNLLQIYRDIKRDILQQVIHASIKGGRSDLEASCEEIERLMDPNEFRATFRDGREGHEGFYAFMNQMSDNTPEFQEIILNLKMLSKQIEFVIHNLSFDDESLFGFFKRLELTLLALKNSRPGYDESKELCRFILEICAGWGFVKGYRDHDIIERMILEL